uniref:Uncharacterized protein n=1 Tax=Physcomitrium patens TaxID=3218 RepID=A0A2K1JKB4_PHYPA|nr:hypothetical protein PHYPA_016827 [Physcomitrium patens]
MTSRSTVGEAVEFAATTATVASNNLGVQQDDGEQNRRITRRKRRGQQQESVDNPQYHWTTHPKKEAPPESTKRNRIMRHRRTLDASTTVQPAPSNAPSHTMKKNMGRAPARCTTTSNSNTIRIRSWKKGEKTNTPKGNPSTLQW